MDSFRHHYDCDNAFPAFPESFKMLYEWQNKMFLFTYAMTRNNGLNTTEEDLNTQTVDSGTDYVSSQLQYTSVLANAEKDKSENLYTEI